MLETYQKIECPYIFDIETKKFKEVYLNPLVELLKDVKWLGSEKYDGTNIRVYYDGYRISFHGRNDNTNMPSEILDLLKKTFDNTEIIFEQNFGNKEVILFMECYGGKVLGSKRSHWYNDSDESLIGFDVMINGKYLDKRKIKPIFDLFNIKTVEFKIYNNLQEILDLVKEETFYQERYFEGIVATPIIPVYDENGNRIIVKVKCKMYRNMLGLGKYKPKRDPKPQVKEKPIVASIDLDKLVKSNDTLLSKIESGEELTFLLDTLNNSLTPSAKVVPLVVNTICLLRNDTKILPYRIIKCDEKSATLEKINKDK